jgi:hypothetical protein
MSSHDADRRHFERQILYARPITILLSILAILEWPHEPSASLPLLLVRLYCC